MTEFATLSSATAEPAPGPLTMPAAPIAPLLVAVTATQTQPSRTAVAASRREAHLDLLKAWRPSVSHPVELLSVRLNSTVAQRLLKLLFFRAQIAVYNTSVMLPILGSQKDAATVEENLNNLMSKIRTELDGEVARLAQICSDNGVDVTTLNYTDARTDTLPAYTPEAKQFLGLLSQFDDLVRYADKLWMSTKWRRVNRDNCVFEWRGKLAMHARELNSLHIRARKAIRRRSEEKAANREAKLARAAARNAGIASGAAEDNSTLDTSAIGAPIAESVVVDEAPSTSDTVSPISRARKSRKKADGDDGAATVAATA